MTPSPLGPIEPPTETAASTTAADTSSSHADLNHTLVPKHRPTFLEGDKGYKSHVHGHSRMDLHPPLLSYLSAPRDEFIIASSTKALVIDFDGTTMKLKYSEGERQEAYRVALKQLVKEDHALELSEDQVDSCHRAAVNNPEAKMAKLLADEVAKNHGLLVDHAKMYAKWLYQCDVQLRSHEARFGRPVKSALVPGIEDLIDAANAREIPVSVCTAGDNQFVTPLLHQSGIMSRLRGAANVFINCHPSIQSKPAGDPYVLAAKLLDIEPCEMLVLEDTATGALAALRAGSRVLLQPSGDREQTIRNLLYHVRKHHPAWLQEKIGAVTVLSEGRGWLQVKFPSPDSRQ